MPERVTEHLESARVLPNGVYPDKIVVESGKEDDRNGADVHYCQGGYCGEKAVEGVHLVWKVGD